MSLGVLVVDSALWLNVPGLSLLLIVCSLCGMVVYGHFRNCDPLETERIEARDQVSSAGDILLLFCHFQ